MPDQPAPDRPAAARQSAPRHRGSADGDPGLLVLTGDEGWLPPAEPSDAELAGCWPDPYAGPPDGEDAWLADLAAAQLDALALELATARPSAASESVGAGFTHRRAAAGIAAGEAGWGPAHSAPHPVGPGSGFAAGGPLDAAMVGPVLAGFAQDVMDGGLAGLSDDELVGLLCAARRLTSWQAATELAAVAELDARRLRAAAAARNQVATGTGASSAVSEHVSAELAAALTLTSRAADGLLGLARELTRLAPVMAALRAGTIDLAKARVFAAELAALGSVQASRIAARYIGRAPGWTTSQLRRALRAAVLAADPAAAKRRADQARKDARVEAWQEGSGNAALSGRELPAAQTIAADARIGRIARALKASGATGTLDKLRAEVFLAILLGKDPGELLGSDEGPGPAGNIRLTPGPAGSPDGDIALTPGSWDSPGGDIHLTLPALTWLGLADRPAELAGLGPLDAHTGRDLAGLLAAGGAAAWHVTLTDADGRAVAHACPRGQPGPPPSTGPPSTGPPGTDPPGPDPRIGWLAGLAFDWLERGECRHCRQTAAYQPGAKLRHLIAVRNPTCAAPGCRRPAARCDNEHTVPFDAGGITCECNCAPVCHRHHRVKQAPGWQLTQPEPGILAWTTPSGRAYLTKPEAYAI